MEEGLTLAWCEAWASRECPLSSAAFSPATTDSWHILHPTMESFYWSFRTSSPKWQNASKIAPLLISSKKEGSWLETSTTPTSPSNHYKYSSTESPPTCSPSSESTSSASLSSAIRESCRSIQTPTSNPQSQSPSSSGWPGTGTSSLWRRATASVWVTSTTREEWRQPTGSECTSIRWFETSRLTARAGHSLSISSIRMAPSIVQSSTTEAPRPSTSLIKNWPFLKNWTLFNHWSSLIRNCC